MAEQADRHADNGRTSGQNTQTITEHRHSDRQSDNDRTDWRAVRQTDDG